MSQIVIFSESIARPSLADKVYDMLLKAIVTGKLASGDELVAAKIAAQGGVSRTPVVEAIQRLESDGFVHHPTNRRPRVAHFTPEDIVEIYDMRSVLETTAAERAATRIGALELSELRNRAEELAACKDDDVEEWSARAIDYDLHFHRVIAHASGNRRLEKDINRYRTLVGGFCRLTGRVSNLKQALQEHLKILEAIEAQDSEAAKLAMARHVKARREAVIREISGAVSNVAGELVRPEPVASLAVQAAGRTQGNGRD